MSKWLILHNNSKFSSVLKEVLGEKAISVNVDELINQISVNVHLEEGVDHRWTISGSLVDDFHQRIIYQEVFFSVESALYEYEKEDLPYVQFGWQAYLLSLFGYAKTVINPVTPENLSISYYQFPRLLALAADHGFSIPKYEVGRLAKENYVAVDSLWFWPGRELKGDAIMNISVIKGKDVVVRFIRYDDTHLVCWPRLPKKITNRLLRLCNSLQVFIGEVYFKVNQDWFFYGLRPQIQTDKCHKRVLLDVAKCLRDIGNEELV
jgi:hypothetical protein